jgi:hypothetical protein
VVHPQLGSMEDVLEKIFLLSYNIKGFSYSDILNLSIPESEWFLDRTMAQKKKEIPK